MAKKIKIDKDACMGCGACVGTASDYFELTDIDGEQKAQVIKQYDEADKDLIEAAADGCPAQAILIEEE